MTPGRILAGLVLLGIELINRRAPIYGFPHLLLITGFCFWLGSILSKLFLEARKEWRWRSVTLEVRTRPLLEAEAWQVFQLWLLLVFGVPLWRWLAGEILSLGSLECGDIDHHFHMFPGGALARSIRLFCLKTRTKREDCLAHLLAVYAALGICRIMLAGLGAFGCAEWISRDTFLFWFEVLASPALLLFLSLDG